MGLLEDEFKLRETASQEFPPEISSSHIRSSISKCEDEIMIINEVSIMDLNMLSTINNQCKTAKSLDRSSPNLFSGLPIVIFIGDFYQFPPVRGPSLWKEPREGNAEDANGQII